MNSNKNSKVMKNFVFVQKYKLLPRAGKEYARIRNRIIEKCQTTKSIFYNWQQGITEIPDHFKPLISEIMDTPQSELFPELETKH